MYYLEGVNDKIKKFYKNNINKETGEVYNIEILNRLIEEKQEIIRKNNYMKNKLPF